MKIITILISVVICYLLSSLIHESGHVICGLLHHWKLYMLVVGPLKLYRESMDSKIKIGIEKNPIVWCGVVTALLLCLMPLAMGTVCIIPMKMKTGLLYNDGTRYKRLQNGGQEGAEERSIFQLLEISLFGREDVIYPTNLVEPLLSSADPEFNYYGYYYAYINAMRKNNTETANLQLENMQKIRGTVSKVVVDDCKIES